MVKRKVDSSLPARDLLPALAARLAGSKSTSFCGQEENLAYLLEMLQRTVDKGESNSLLVLGPRGVGKSALVQEVLVQARRSKTWQENVVLVQLSGLVQTDDRVALRDITKQLNLENVVGDRVFGSFSEHLSFLLASLKTGDSSTSKPIVFILEEFDSFCSHKNQTLLYNLFDVAQSRAVPICVLGISCQIDVTELLEKRVKSRFSHRHLYMWPPQDSTSHLTTVRHLLTLATETSVDWDSDIQELFDSPAVVKLMDAFYAVNKSLAAVKKLLYLAVILMMKSGAGKLELVHLKSAKDSCLDVESSNSETNQILDLPILELCLLIAIKHLTQIYDNEPFNFEMVFHEFVKFKRRKMPNLPDVWKVLE
jgi:origin recognition complex subunit 4